MKPTSFTLAIAAFFALSGAALAQPAGDGGGGPGGPGGHGGVRAACQADIAKFCGDAQPGGSGGHGEMRRCLAFHANDLSDACKAALARMRQWRQDHRPSSDQGPPPDQPPPDQPPPPQPPQ